MHDSVNILLVDDQPENLMALESVLAPLSERIVLARSGREALREVLRQDFGVILLDVHMPGLDGYETATLIRDRDRNTETPIIFITANDADQHRMASAYSAGAVDYIVKPFDPDVLRSKVRVFTQLFRKNQETERQAKLLRMLAMELSQTEQRERRRLAQMLHDHLQQLMVAGLLKLRVMAGKVHSDELQISMDELRELLQQGIEWSRTLTVELSPPVLYDAGIEAALRWLARWMEEKHHLQVKTELALNDLDIGEELGVLLFQCTRELLFNALKHAGVDQVVLRGFCQSQWIVIQVEDAGRGFQPADIQRLQQPSTFGLFSIRERLNVLHGQFEIESKPGQGARLTLRAPLPKPIPGSKEPDVGTRRRESLRVNIEEGLAGEDQRISVMIVDDHKIVREGLSSLLCQAGMHVVAEACDGESAIELAHRYRPRVVVMDISMPGINGVEATRRILRELPETRIIGLSMHEAEEMGSAMLQAGAERFFSKDGPAEAIIDAIHTTCESQTT